MREQLYRAKRVDDRCRWAEGHLVGEWIIVDHWTEESEYWSREEFACDAHKIQIDTIEVIE